MPQRATRSARIEARIAPDALRVVKRPQNCRAAVSAILWLPQLRRSHTGQSTKPRSFACPFMTSSAL